MTPNPPPPTIPDLTICDREPITRLDQVQSFGFLLALSDDWVVVRASANVAAFLGVTPDVMIGSSLDRWISKQAVHSIRNRMAKFLSAGTERLYGVELLPGREETFDLALHLAGDLLVVEGERSHPEDGTEAASMVRALIARLNAISDLEVFHRDAARQVRAITGFDRVMIYRFDQTGTGIVIADSVKAGVESFLGLHFPASDIPVQARALYLRNPFRIIADLAAMPVPLEPPEREDILPLDLSMAITRAVSPVHIEYLKNMGIGASLSISIIVEGRLWGLIACHHQTALLPGFVMRTAAELFGQMYSMTLESRLHSQAAEEEKRTRRLTDRLITAVAGDGDLLVNAEWLRDIGREIIDCDGVAIYRGGTVFSSGATPPETEIRLLAEVLNVTSPNGVFATNHLASILPSCAATADHAAGMLAIPVSKTPRDYIMLFRRERVQEMTWAGEPGKAVTESDSGVRLSPRKSFAAYAELVRGRATPFTDLDLRIGEAIRISLIEVILRFSESAHDERKLATQRQELLIAELNHRVRNILALIRGLITQTGRSASDVMSYVDGLNGRVQALARAHDQITQQNWGPGSITALFDDEIAAHCPNGPGQFVLTGPVVLLQPIAITTLALVIHELVTNSVKHGALSAAGTVYVTVELDDAKGVWLRWRERGGPAVQAPTRRGFGSVIVERSVPFDLNGVAEIRYLLAGFEADFLIPSEHVWFAPLPGATLSSGANTRGVVAAVGSAKDQLPLKELQILLVEDNMMIALEAEDMLTALGARSVTTVSTLPAAAAAAATDAFDLAVLDINVGQGTSFDFAARLKALDIPYFFASGYGDQVTLDQEHSASFVIQKPYDQDLLRRAIQRLNVRGRQSADTEDILQS